ncbi:hypothetical protein [Deinococcus budaensis]|uniref:Uncharacterized protein n=1 Tax=Deinococcus budaensis TaxID=1665626 RepID=A0A7W8GHP9_9DEIO|nr:hypothetical protein [Deinococcus budaensis]MBB5235366.1 hypothetical protein [Deinococcus budaensis]
MRRATLVGLLALQGWAAACSPVEAPPGVVRALQALERASAGVAQAPCRPRPPANCTVYRLSPPAVARLLAQAHGTPARRTANTWTVTERAESGRTALIRAAPGGSVREIRDTHTAYEQLSERLNRPDARSARWRTCSQAGLTRDVAFTVQACGWGRSPQFGPARVFQFTVVRAADASLPAGRYLWFPNDGANCGGLPIHQKS